MKLKNCFLTMLTLSTVAVFPLCAEDKPADGERHEKMRAKMLEKFDTNKDGKLDEMEKAAAKEAGGHRLDKFIEKHPEFLKKHDANGDGKLDETERKAAHQAMEAERMKFDTNKDGKLDQTEREAMKAAHQAQKAK